MGFHTFKFEVNDHTYVGGLVGGDDQPIFPGDVSCS